MLKQIPFYASLLDRDLEGGVKSSTGHVLVYGAIEAHALGPRGCVASNKTIALETGLSESRTRNCLSEISRAGWVRVNLDKNNHRIGVIPLLVIGTPLTVSGNPPYRVQEPPHTVSGNIEYSIENTVKENSITPLTAESDLSLEEKTEGSSPNPIHSLVEYVRTLQGLKGFASKEPQYAAAKRIFKAGYSLDDARRAAERMFDDSYWASQTFDLIVLARHITRYSKEDVGLPYRNIDEELAQKGLTYAE